MNALRWILLAPGALLAYVAAYATGKLLHWISFSYFSFWDADAIIPKLISTAFASVFGGYGFVVAIGRIAPSRKRDAALLLSGLMLAVFVLSLLNATKETLPTIIVDTLFTVLGLFSGFEAINVRGANV